MKQNEPELIAHILNGQTDLYGLLIDRYKEGLYRHCFRIVRDEDWAEDIAQESFIQALLRLHTYKPTFRFSTWLYKIATNVALGQLRKRQPVQLDEAQWSQLPSLLPPLEQVVKMQEVFDAIDQLPETYRTVITLHFWEGYTYQEIADQLDAPVGSVKGWVSRARHQLKEILS